jgi:hypothetical protein
MKSNYVSEPFSGRTPTATGLPAPVIIQMQPEIARAVGEEVSPVTNGQSGNASLGIPPETAQVITPGDAKKVEDLFVTWAEEQLTHAKAQTEDIYKRCQAALAAKNRSSRTVTQSSAAGSLGSKVYDSEAADHVDDATGLQKELIFQDGRLAKVEYGPSEKPERAMVLQMALDDELRRGNAEDETETSLHRFILYPYSGFKAVRDYRKGRQCFYPKALNPMTIAVSDIGRGVQQQYTIHEAHFFTKREMTRASFQNLDKLGSPDGMGRNSIYPLLDKNNPNTGAAPNPNSTYEVYETWGEPPIGDWLHDGKCNDYDLNAFALKYGFQPQDLEDDGSLHCIFHKDKQLLKWYPSYLVDKTEFPYYTASHYPAENRFHGEAQMERVADAHNAKHILLNDAMDNMRMIGNQSMFYKTSASVSPEMLDRITKPRGRVPVAGNDAFEDMFMFFKPDNIVPDLMSLLNYWQGRIKEGGIDDVLRGKAKPRTATQSENDNARSQSTINHSGTRFVRQALKPCLRAILHMIVANYSRQDWHEIAGEDGNQMITEPWMVDPLQIDKHFTIVPVASYDFQSQAQKIQEIVNVVGVFAPFLQPQQGVAAFEEAIKLTSLKKNQIDNILGSVGTATDALEEVETMIDNQWTEPAVIEADDHESALRVGMAAGKANPKLMEQRNFRRWMLKHQLYWIKQQREQLMARAEQEARTPQGKTKQLPPGGVNPDEQSMARQNGQTVSPPDNAQPNTMMVG